MPKVPVASLALTSLLLAACGKDSTAPSVEPRVVTLTVRTATDVLVAGSVVEVWDDEPASGQPPKLGLSTDDSGLLKLPLASRDAVFSASVPGVATSGLWSARTLEGDALTVRLFPLGSIDGRVLSAEGQPMAGARVHFEPAPVGAGLESGRSGWGVPRQPPDVTSDAAGHFRVVAEWGFAGMASAVVANERTPPALVHWAWGSTRPVTLQLPGRFRIRGVLVGPDGAPVVGRSLCASRRSQDPARAETSEDGSFEIALVQPGLYQVELSRSFERVETVLAERVMARVSEDAPVAEVRLQLTQAATIRGRVPPTAEGVLSVYAEPAQQMPPARTRSWSEHARTAEDGSFELRGLLPGVWYDVVASVRGRRDANAGNLPAAGVRVPNVLAGSDDVQLPLDAAALAGGTAIVHCVDAVNGTPLKDAVVEEQSWSVAEHFAHAHVPANLARADALGAARFDRLSLAHCRVFEASAPGHAPIVVGPFEAGSAAVEVWAELVPLASRHLWVNGPDGLPFPRAVVAVCEAGKLEPRSMTFVRTFMDFPVRIDGPVDQALWVQSSAEGLVSDLVSVVPNAGGEQIVLRLQPPASLPARGALDVFVRDALGLPLAGALVHLESLSNPVFRGDGGLVALTDARGHVAFEGLLPAVWETWCDDLDRGLGNGLVAVTSSERFCLDLDVR